MIIRIKSNNISNANQFTWQRIVKPTESGSVPDRGEEDEGIGHKGEREKKRAREWDG